MLTVEMKALLRALTVLELVPTRPGIPASEFIRVSPQKQQGWLHAALSSEVNGLVILKGEGKWPFKEDVYIDRRLFIPFIKAGAEVKGSSTVTFFVEKEEIKTKKTTETKKLLVVKHGKRKAKFYMAPPVPGYGTPIKIDNEAQAKSTINISDDAKEIIFGARECATTDHTTPELNCVYFTSHKDHSKIYATNQTIQFRANLKETSKIKEPIPFPLFLVTLIGSEGLKTIQWRDTEVVLQFGTGFIWQTVSSKAKTKFPSKSIDTWMSKDDDVRTCFQAKTKDFCNVLERIGSYLTAVRRQDWLLHMTGTKGKTTIELTVAIAQGAFKEQIVLDEPVKTDFTIEWPLDMLLPVFDAIHTDKGLITVKTAPNRSKFSTQRVSVIVPTRKA